MTITPCNNPHLYLELQRLGGEMRHAQREYFRTRSMAWLRQSKQLEGQFDVALRELQGEPPKSTDAPPLPGIS